MRFSLVPTLEFVITDCGFNCEVKHLENSAVPAIQLLAKKYRLNEENGHEKDRKRVWVVGLSCTQ